MLYSSKEMTQSLLTPASRPPRAPISALLSALLTPSSQPT